MIRYYYFFIKDSWDEKSKDRRHLRHYCPRRQPGKNDIMATANDEVRSDDLRADGLIELLVVKSVDKFVLEYIVVLMSVCLMTWVLVDSTDGWLHYEVGLWWID